MPYIASEEVKEIRKAVRKALPEFKISVTRRHYSSVDVRVMSGPLSITSEQFGEGRLSVNLYHYARTMADKPEIKAVVDKIIAAMDSVVKNYITHEDGDYGSIPNHYRDVAFGKWDKPYVQTA